MEENLPKQPEQAKQPKQVALCDYSNGATLCNIDKALHEVEAGLKPEEKEEKDKREFPLDVTSKDTETGEKPVDILRLLFRNSLLTRLDSAFQKINIQKNGSVVILEEDNYPLRHNPARLSPELVTNFRVYGEDLLPSPEDPDFASALRDRSAGVFYILHHFTHLIDDIGDPILVLRWLAAVARDQEDKKITEFPWQDSKDAAKGEEIKLGRRTILSRRMNSVETNVYTLRAEYIANQKIAGFIAKIPDPETRSALEGLFRTFWDRLNNKCPWLNGLNERAPLAKVKNICAVLEAIAQFLKETKDLDEIKKAALSAIGKLPNIKDQQSFADFHGSWLKKEEKASGASDGGNGKLKEA